MRQTSFLFVFMSIIFISFSKWSPNLDFSIELKFSLWHVASGNCSYTGVKYEKTQFNGNLKTKLIPFDLSCHVIYLVLTSFLWVPKESNTF